MRPERNQHGQGQNKRGPAHRSVAVAQRVNAAVQPVVLDRSKEQGGQHKKNREGIGGGIGGQHKRRSYSQRGANTPLASRTLSLGIFWPLGIHGVCPLGETCPPPRPPARGALLMTVAAFAMCGWVLLRGVV